LECLECLGFGVPGVHWSALEFGVPRVPRVPRVSGVWSAWSAWGLECLEFGVPRVWNA